MHAVLAMIIVKTTSQNGTAKVGQILQHNRHLCGALEVVSLPVTPVC